MPKLSALELPNNKIEDNQLIKITTPMLKPKLIASIKKSKKKVNFIDFDLKQNDLNLKTGQKILNFLIKMNQNKINFKVAKPLPRCLFGLDYNEIVKKFDIPISCAGCMELFTTQEDGTARFCEVLDNRLGPKIEFMKDREQIYEYFYTFYKYLKPSTKCKTCITFQRGNCSGLCFKI